VHNHLIPGRGAVRFLEVLQTMVRVGYRGDISLELYPYVDMPEEAGRESLQYLRAIFQEAGLEVGGLASQS
jgi:sugar phosphate isomerase/epimerase